MTAAHDRARPSGSGDLLADKRYAVGEALLQEGDPEGAADLFAQAAEKAPDWAPAYLAQGLALERAGRPAEALAVLREAGARDRDGRLGAALHAARLTGAAVAGMPAAYVAALFDDYAPRFDAHLVERLGYRGPAVILAALDAAAPGERTGPVLDLGCGTGLMARALGPQAAPIDGVDLSAEMLAQAEATGFYRALTVGDCAAVAASLAPGRYRVALAADVLVYLGDLAPLFAATARVLRPGGLFAATLQAGAEPYGLGPDLRFAHGPGYVRTALADAGFRCLALDPCVTRRDGGRDVPGLVFTARRS